MSDRENFLSRWSRRKRAAAREDEASTRPESVPSPAAAGDKPEEEDRQSGADSRRRVSAPPALTFDPASLPPIHSITADTDIRGFLGSGVPSELTRAALRRAWACDPKIKNFVGLAEYDWDFNAPDSMAGFGPLQVTDEVGKMVARIVEPDRSEPAPRNLVDPATKTPKAEQVVAEANTDAAHGAAAKMHDEAEYRDESVKEIGAPVLPGELTRRKHEPTAAHREAAKSDKRNAFVRRPHGGALPK